MNYQLPQHIEDLRGKAREFFDAEIRAIADKRDQLGPLSKAELQDLIKLVRPLGWVTAPIAREYGGEGRSVLERAVLGEEASRVWPALASTIDTHMGIAAAVVSRGADWMREKYLAKAIAGEAIFCDMTSEPGAGSDTRAFTTLAVLEGDHYIVNGEKTWNTNGPWADVGVLTAVIDPEAYSRNPKQGLVQLLVEKSASEWTVNDLPFVGFRAGTTGHFVFKNMKVPKGNAIGELSDSYSENLKTRGWARVSLAAKAVGLMQAALEDAVSFAKERVTFGKRLGSHQLVQDMIADMAMDLEASRLLTYRAAELMDNGVRCDAEQAMAKAFATEAVKRVTDKALQIHGARGLTTQEGYRTERMYRDARMYSIPEGTTQILKLIIGRSILGMQAFA
jgi:alkylation response protein AidB-like acyl-CoA dehydrogenase